MKVTFEDRRNRITNVKFQTLHDYPITMTRATFGSFNGRSLIMGGDDSNGECLEFDQEEYQVIPSLNINRFFAASTFIQNKVVVAGGCDEGFLDTIEILDWDESHHGSQWIESPLDLPVKVGGHTLVSLNNILVLIGDLEQDKLGKNHG